MEPLQSHRIDEIEELVKENNELLKKIHRGMLLRRILSVVYWVIIIGVALGVLYFLQPYVELFRGAIEQLGNIFDLFEEEAAAGSVSMLQIEYLL